jgi:hypothetical protein
MISILAEKPSAFPFEETGDVYYKLSDKDGVYAYAALNFFYKPVAVFHLEVERFTHNILRKAVKDDWLYFTSKCEQAGCKTIVIDKPGSFDKNKTWMKFIKHFGFNNFTQFTASSQPIGG